MPGDANDPFESFSISNNIEKIGPPSVDEKDEIIARLGKEKCEKWNDLLETYAEGVYTHEEYTRVYNKLTKILKRFESKKFLFWDEIEKADIKLEVALRNGKILNIKKDTDDSLVVVKSDPPTIPGPEFFFGQGS